jgi:hypothetical protein
MNLGADVMRDEANNAFAVGGREPFSGVGEPLGQAVDPEPPVGIEHHLDDRRVFQESGDGGAEGCAQHARASQGRL